MPFDGSENKPNTLIRGETILLLRAKELIQNEKDWNIGKLHSPEIPRWKFWNKTSLRYCAVGAWSKAAELFDQGSEAKKRARDILTEIALKHGFDDISSMNDYPGMTHDRIMQAYDEAIELSMQPIKEIEAVVSVTID